MSDGATNDKDRLARAAEALKAGRLDEADRLFERVCAGEAPAEGFHGRGIVAASQGDFAGAEKHFQQACDLDPDNPLYRYQLGVSMLATSRIEPALESFERSVELDPDLAPAWFNLGGARRQAGLVEAAVDAYRRASEGPQGIPQARLAIVETLRTTGSVEEAATSARDALEHRKDWPEAWAELGLCLAASNDLEGAVDCWRRAVEFEPKFVDARFHLGVGLAMLGKLDEAETAYRSVLELLPDHVKAAVNLSGILMHRGELEECDRVLASAIRHEGPDRAIALIAFGDLKMRRRSPSDAEACYRDSIKLLPAEPRPRIALIACLLEQGKHADALAAAEQLDRDFPGTPIGAECLSEALCANDRFEQALVTIEACIDRHGPSPLRHTIRATACEGSGNLTGARAAFEAALALDPEFGPALQGKARLA